MSLQPLRPQVQLRDGTVFSEYMERRSARAYKARAWGQVKGRAFEIAFTEYCLISA